MSIEEQAVRDVHATWIEAVNAADLARLLSLMTDDVVFLNPGHAPFGRDGFPVGFLDAHHRYRLRCTSDLIEVAIIADHAYTVCRDSVSITPRNGEAASEFAGHRLTIYRQQADGRWLLARDAHTVVAVVG